MRLTINLDDRLYAVAKSLARTEDCSISAAVNNLLRRGLAAGDRGGRRKRRGLPVVACPQKFTSDDVYVLDSDPS
jgi:Arc/MetJ family transcription regulator